MIVTRQVEQLVLSKIASDEAIVLCVEEGNNWHLAPARAVVTLADPELKRTVLVSTKLDTTAVSVGKRYARTDELGVPFAVTVDHRSLEDDTVTVRERDSCEQVRVKTAEVLPLVTKLCSMRTTWGEATAGMEKQTAAAE